MCKYVYKSAGASEGHKECVGSPGPAVTGHCDPCDVDDRNLTHVLWKHSLATEPSLQLSDFF